MADIINVLPDSVANQIAAGEVIVRPASVVKELLENSVDAGATDIKLIINDAGKTLIQVIDNGKGMSETDARLCFERHATSKLRKIDDLYELITKGFRGEALAAIAAVAQVELKSRLPEADAGTIIEIEGSVCKKQEPIACATGTSIAVKNLFFNVPARRNFLKSNNLETKHIIEEFERVALPHHNLSWSLMHNGLEVYNLRPGNLRQRICALYGAAYNERLVPVNEDTSIIAVTGFIGKPEFAKRKRGEQYFFINDRYIRNAFLHHAVNAGFEDLLPKETFPSYWLNITINPATIDINIHPTKTEINFEDEKSVYSILRATIKQSLGKYSISPTLDFEQEKSFDLPLSKLQSLPQAPQLSVNKDYNPFNLDNYVAPRKLSTFEQQTNVTKSWDILQRELSKSGSEPLPTRSTFDQEHFNTHEHFDFVQLLNTYIVVRNPLELLLIDQQLAHEKIIYHRVLAQLHAEHTAMQQKLFPTTLELNAQDTLVLQELLPQLQKIGFEINEFGGNSFVVNGMPSYFNFDGEQNVIEKIIEQYKNNSTEFKQEAQSRLAMSVAMGLSIKRGSLLSKEELKKIYKDLLLCPNYETTNTGKPIVVRLNKALVQALFERKSQ